LPDGTGKRCWNRSDGVSLEIDGHITWLKWHRGHRQAGDISFTAERISEGLALGASVEIDLVCHADGGFAVLHDKTLERSTTGSGRVADATAATLRQLRLRDPKGNATRHPVMLLDDLADLLSKSGLGKNGLLQLDMKEISSDIGDSDIAAFTSAIAPVCNYVILSGGDAEAVQRLSEALPAMRTGYDPCLDGAIEQLTASRDFSGFVAKALAASPRAEMIYLEYRLILLADTMGFNLIEAFHQAGKTIDAYTINHAVPGNLPDVMRLLALRADQITTDDPVGLEALVHSALHG
jgi:glycerophosphoryl diester phosphodiesterase